jgi:hypothetical protein
VAADVATLSCVAAVEIAILVGAALVFFATMSVVMVRVNRNERRRIERRRQLWIDAGADPDDEPNFYSKSTGGSGGA